MKNEKFLEDKHQEFGEMDFDNQNVMLTIGSKKYESVYNFNIFVHLHVLNHNKSRCLSNTHCPCVVMLLTNIHSLLPHHAYF